ncbi:lipoate--protein ligase family protein [Anatilimnocola floriformis]|uniref:lipoate--protein ligase family protein n=1 Tax=Anatilimnocola floriformis TaxID=2948575 RepID=UPI0020C54F94|nr:lipoate--protein ligase family protein [Anatilimnocola floriformis]
MQLLDLTLPTAAENLALDEALLESVDDQPGAAELLRVWECPQWAVVLGRSGKVAEEVFESRAGDVPILRRTSGGGTVLLGPGCLMYSLRLSYERRPHLRALDQAHHEVLTTLAAALNRKLPDANVRPRGTSDLAIGERKFSGNSLRCKRNFLLYHGTLLYDFDLSRIESLLRPPPRQPEYREERPHRDFVMNLALSAGELRQALIAAWQANEILQDWPRELTERLLRERYEQPAWNFER